MDSPFGPRFSTEFSPKPAPWPASASKSRQTIRLLLWRFAQQCADIHNRRRRVRNILHVQFPARMTPKQSKRCHARFSRTGLIDFFQNRQRPLRNDFDQISGSQDTYRGIRIVKKGNKRLPPCGAKRIKDIDSLLSTFPTNNLHVVVLVLTTIVDDDCSPFKLSDYEWYRRIMLRVIHSKISLFNNSNFFHYFDPFIPPCLE
jgi:hypothetical protein